MAKTRKYLTHEITIHEGNDSVVVHAPLETKVTVDPWGIVTYEFGGRRIIIAGVDSGPGGVTIFVDGPHEDGTP